MVLRGAAITFALLVLTGCLDAGTAACIDGRVCPAGQVCDEAHQLCAFPDQFESCVGHPDGDDCDPGGGRVGICDLEVCLPQICGDGRRSGTESCDGDDLGDGAAPTSCAEHGFYEGGDVVGCLPNCRFDTGGCARTCGDAIVDADGGEQCDDPSRTIALACTDPQFGFYEPGEVPCNDQCRWDVTGCTASCGDGIVNGPELCDGAPPPETCLNVGFDAGFLECSLCSAGLAGCRTIDWDDVSSGTSDVIYALHGTGPDDIWVAHSNTIVHLDELGAHLEPHPAMTGLEAVWAIAPDDVWVGGASGALHRDASGWNAVPGITNVRSLWASGPGDVWATTGSALMRHDGTAWQVVTGVGLANPVGVFGTAADDVYVWDGTLVHFDGTSWQPVPTALTSVNDVWAAPTGELFVGGTQGSFAAVYYVDGAGPHVHTLALPANSFVTSMWGTSASDVYAAGDRDVVLHWNGSSWTNLADQLDHTYHAVWASAPDDVWVAGVNGVLRHYEGSRWRDGAAGLTLLNVYGLVLLHSELAYMVGQPASPPGLYRWAFGSWTLLANTLGGTPLDLATTGAEIYIASGNPGTDDTGEISVHTGGGYSVVYTGPDCMYAVWTPAAGRAWAVGAHGAIVHRDATGWVATPSGTTETLREVWGSSDSDVWAVGDAGTIVHWDGATWTATPSGVTSTLRAIWGAGPTDITVVGDGAVALHWNGVSWQPRETRSTADLFTITGLGPDDIFAAGSGGTVLHWDGAHWAPVRRDTSHAITNVSGVPGAVFFGDTAGRLEILERTTPW